MKRSRIPLALVLFLSGCSGTPEPTPTPYPSSTPAVTAAPTGPMKLVLADGSIYEGTIVDGKATGTGTINYKNGNVYTGEVVDGIPQG